ncbi:MAG TPA: DegT/DnrJ/EryC1/StrS family aminotransferase [Candidatus Nanoarchaeia archaeon]|nr:DegT/DnrJ/EryC1/StrS family aminotransferase [Candidatus Nanoarchaeia archaeon]
MKVPFADITRDENETFIEGEGLLKDRIKKNIEDVIERKNFILGDYVGQFERDFAGYCGTKYCIGVGNGLSALELSLISLGIKQGDEVITAANTFNATVGAILKTGARPAFVDADYKNFNIDVSQIRQKITDNTKAIIPVHLYGQLAGIGDILFFAKNHNIKVVEDACQAHGAMFRGMRAGSFGEAGCFSFYPGKNLGAYGDAGAVVTDDEAVADCLKKMRNYGQAKKYMHDSKPDNSRLDTIQAAVLVEKLKVLDKWNEMRIKNAEIYRQKLGDVPEIELPGERKEGGHVYHLFVIKTEKREGLEKYLEEKGVQTGKHYPVPIHLQPCFSHLGYKKGDFPVSERLSENILSLPMFPSLREEEINYVSGCIKDFYSKPSR